MADGERREARVRRATRRARDAAATARRTRRPSWSASASSSSARLFDEPTISRLRRFGAQPGWNCLEIGAGSGSVARALAVVGRARRARARHRCRRPVLEGDEHHLEFRVHDIARDPLPADRFDLAHARGVLEHIGERERALADDGRARRSRAGSSSSRTRTGSCSTRSRSRTRSARCTASCATLVRGRVGLRPEPRRDAAARCSRRRVSSTSTPKGTVFTMHGCDAVDGVVRARARALAAARSSRPGSSTPTGGRGSGRGARSASAGCCRRCR